MPTNAAWLLFESVMLLKSGTSCTVYSSIPGGLSVACFWPELLKGTTGLPGVALAGLCAGLEKVDGLCWLDVLPGLSCGGVFGLEAGECCCLKIDAFP